MRLIRFIIYSNILVSLAAGMLTFGVSTYFAFSDAPYYGWCSGMATLFLYNLQRLMRFEDVKVQASDRHKWLVEHKRVIQWLCGLGAAGALMGYLSMGVSQDIYLIGALTLIGFFYAYRGKRSHALRDIPYLKIYLIALVWAVVSVMWAAYREEVWNDKIALISGVVFLYILATTVPFDVRDLIYDSEQQKTIPQLIGKRRSKWISAMALILSAGILSASDSSFFANPLFYCAYLGMIAFIIFTDEKRSEMYFSGWIDGWILLFSAMFLVA